MKDKRSKIPDNIDAMEINKQRWNELVDVHTGPRSTYKPDTILQGKSVLSWVEKELLGDDIKGKKVLHLQCHFGMDTISLHYEGASEVVGVDYSEKAVEMAGQLAEEAGVSDHVRFVHANIMELTDKFDEFGSFDYVFTSYGTIVWLPDLEKWAKAISAYLKPGGKFLFIDSHPFSHVFYDESEEQQLLATYRYFEREQPEYYKVEGSYASDAVLENNDEYIWTHSVSSIINNLITNGMVITEFNEYPYISWQQFPFLVQKENKWYYFPDDWEQSVIPLCLALQAKKPQNQI